MKGWRTLFSLILLMIGLSLGIWIGFSFGGWLKEGEIPFLGGSQPTAQSSGQRKILVIGVDEISTSARLVGAWYVTYLPEEPIVVLMPLYPDGASQGGGRQDEIAASFKINRKGTIARSFFQAVQEQYRFDWGGYVLIDQIAMMGIIDYLGGVDLGHGPLNGPLAVGDVPPPWQDPHAALNGQARLVASLCQGLETRSTVLDLYPLLPLIPEHIRSDMKPDLAVEDWLKLNSNEAQIECEFPTLEFPHP